MFFDKFDVTTIQTKAHRHLHAVGYAVARLIAVRVRAFAYVRGAGLVLRYRDLS
jgi:hypothetical protein